MYLSCGDQRSTPEDKSIFHDLMEREREKESKSQKLVSGMLFSGLAKLTFHSFGKSSAYQRTIYMVLKPMESYVGKTFTNC